MELTQSKADFKAAVNIAKAAFLSSIPFPVEKVFCSDILTFSLFIERDTVNFT